MSAYTLNSLFWSKLFQIHCDYFVDLQNYTLLRVALEFVILCHDIDLISEDP